MRWLAVILGVSLGLNFFGLDHGDPIAIDRAIDAIHPLSSLELSSGLGETDTKYPRLQFRITGAAYRAWLFCTLGGDGKRQFERDLVARAEEWRKGGVDATAQDELTGRVRRLIVIGRGISAVMGTLVVLFLFLFARELLGHGAGLIAAAFATLNWPLVYYSHQLNLDVPYLAWSFLALWLAARAIRTGRSRLLVHAAVAAACAIGTKDQAYGLFVLTAPVVLFLYLRPGSLAEPASSTRPAPWAALGLAVLAAGLVLLLLPGFPIDWDWHRRHFEHITTAGSAPYRSDLRTFAGQWTLLEMNAWLVALGIGAPAAIFSLMGAALLVVRCRRRALLVLVPVVSCVATFLIPAGFTYLRFTLPVQLLLLLPFADLIARAAARGGKVLGGLVIALLLAFNGFHAVEVVRLLVQDDTRSRAERYLRSQFTPDTRIHGVLDAMGVNVLLPPWPGVTEQAPGPPPPELDQAPPDVIVLSFFEYFDPASAGKAHSALETTIRRFGRTYELAIRFAPGIEHPIRESVAAQPIVLIYRATGV